MADEITVSGAISYSKNGAELANSKAALSITAAGNRCVSHVQAISSSEEAIELGEMTAPGYCYFKNLDSTITIELRVATGGAKFAKLKAGEFCILRLGSGAQAPYAIADSGTPLLLCTIIET